MVPLTVQSLGRWYIFQARPTNETDVSFWKMALELTVRHHERDVESDLPVVESLFGGALHNAMLCVGLIFMHDAILSWVRVVVQIVTDEPLSLGLRAEEETKAKGVE